MPPTISIEAWWCDSRCSTLRLAHLYNRDPEGLDSTKLSAELRERYTPFHQLEGTHMEAAFDHLNGYSAVYYTYMWSLVIAKDMFTQFNQNGMLAPKVAAKYRETVLAASGTKQAADLCTSWASLLIPGLCKLAEREVNFRENQRLQ